MRGTGPDEYDRVMGVTSVGSHETVRFGEENLSGLEMNQEGVAHNSVDLDLKERINVMRMILVLARFRWDSVVHL